MKRSMIACLALIVSCAEPEEPITDVIAHGGHRAMTTEPAWSVTGPLDTSGACFGAAVAVEDLDGDGRRDLVVAELGCFFDRFAPGRIGIYRGVGGAFATTPVWTTLDWGRPPLVAFSVSLSTADVDGDGRPDLLVGNANGALVYAGITSIAAPLPAPTYRVPGTGRFGRAVLADVDGDDDAEIVSVRAGTATVWRATGATLVATRTIAATSTVVDAGDVEGDGKDDVVVISTAGTSSLYRGCNPAAATCSGGLRTAPSWIFAQAVVAMVPDLDDDGRKDALVRDAGQSSGWLWLHRSHPTAGLEPDAAWSTLGDPNYPVFGQTVVVPGELDGDRHTTDLVIGGAGRAYGFFPRGDHHLDRLEPGFAWPRADRTQAQLLDGEPTFGGSVMSIAAAGDLDRDGYADLVIAAGSEELDQKPGSVYLFRGGKVKRGHGHDAPYLPGAPTCALPSTGLPDLTVDAAALARSLYVEAKEFAPDACELAEECVGGPGVRKLLRFTTSIANLGAGPAIIPGPETAPELYHFDECHGHDHLEDFARYELVDAAGVPVAIGRKQGFFLIDTQPYCIDGPAATDYFPDQGISPGWSDVYVAAIPCQWIDVTDVPNGTYTLNVTADSRHLVEQDDVHPDTVSIRLRLGSDRVRVLP